MNSDKLRRLRHQAFRHQNFLCFYCKFPMWDSDPRDFSIEHNIPSRLSKHLKCTAEHLVPRQDSGKDSTGNIVAACLWCNRMRHQGRPHKAPDAATYRMQVVRWVAAGRWHPIASSRRIVD
ncbi:HNH endonuclease [Massilia violaceinigra]|uniref:HNH endonuclease n=1 Tax=Massilia violaceinigra TaxID=2045208 RepID=A0ABY4AAN2_9BURK|nr:HNH endonuclease [Massilia violaceinigra]